MLKQLGVIVSVVIAVGCGKPPVLHEIGVVTRVYPEGDSWQGVMRIQGENTSVRFTITNPELLEQVKANLDIPVILTYQEKRRHQEAVAVYVPGPVH